MFLFERNTAFVLQGSLPGDCHASLAMTEYFVRNITRVCLPESICRIFVLSLFYPVQRTLCLCERKYGDPAGYCIMGPNGILCTRGEKEYASVRQTFVACDDCLVKNEAYDAEEKAHTSKRVSVIACDNVISKVQLSGTPRDTVYSRGKGAHKQKTNNCRLRRLFGQKCSVRRGARQYHRNCGGIVF